MEQNEAASRFLAAYSDASVGSLVSQLAADGPMGALPDFLACADPDRGVWREHAFTARATGQQ